MGCVLHCWRGTPRIHFQSHRAYWCPAQLWEEGAHVTSASKCTFWGCACVGPFHLKTCRKMGLEDPKYPTMGKFEGQDL